MTTLLNQYLEIFVELVMARAARPLTEDEEAAFSMRLYDCRLCMSDAEESRIGDLLRIAQQRWST